MSVNAVFVADFSKFDTAVKNATVSLKSIEAGASSVEGSLNRMANQFTGVKVIQQATLMAEAIERVGGVSTLTATELKRVGAQADEATAKLVALGEKVPPEIQKVSDAFHKLQDEEKALREQPDTGGGFLKDFGSQAAATAAGMVSAQAAMQALGTAWHATTDFVKDSIAAYANAESADLRMVAAMKQHGIAAEGTIAQFRDLATQFQATTVYSDDLIQKMEGLFVQVGDIGPAQMEKALTAATDLASGLGIDLDSATRLVARAAEGHTETLGRYGITVDQAKLATEGFNAVLESINKQFGGQAAAQAETYAGKVQKIANSYDNVQEAAGKLIVTSPIAERALNRTAEATKAVDDATKDATLSWGDLAVAFAGPNLGSLIGATEHITAVGNALEKMTAQLDKAKPSLRLPEAAEPAAGLTMAMGLQKQQEQSAAALKEISEKTGAATQTTSALQAAVDELDGSVAEGIQYYKDLGISVENVANWYGVTVDQVDAVLEANKRYNQYVKAADAERVRMYQQQSELAAKGTERRAKDLGPEAQIAALRALAAAEQERARAAFQFIATDEERMKVVEANAKRQLEIQDQIIAKERERIAVVNDAVVRELNARARVAEKQGTTLEGAAMPKELAENPFVVLQKTLADIDAQAQKGISTDKQREEATMKFTETLNEAAKANDTWIASLKPKTGMFAAGESVTPWSTLAPKAIELKEIGVKYKETPKSAETNVPVTVNVSGVWDPASVGKIVDVIAPELMRRTGRQLPAA